MRRLTHRQVEVLDFIRGHFRTKYVPPTIREIMDHMGFRSPNAVVGHLNALEAKGEIQIDRGTARGIRLVGDVCPTCGTPAHAAL